MIAGGFLNLYNAKKQPDWVAFLRREGFFLRFASKALRANEPEGAHPSLSKHKRAASH